MTYYDHATGLTLGLGPWNQKQQQGHRRPPVEVRRKSHLAALIGALLRMKWRVRGLPGG